MTQQLIITTPANTGTGDSPKSAFDKVNANFSDLYAGTGQVYTPPFTGGVATTVSAKLAQTVSVIDFGADPTGNADSTAAFTNAATALTVGGGTIYLPPGTYKFSSITLPAGVVLSGAGVFASTLKCTSATATAIFMNSATELMNLQITSAVTRTAGYYVDIEGNGVRIENCQFSGYFIAISVGVIGGTLPSYPTISNCSFFNPVVATGAGGIQLLNFSNAALFNLLLTGPTGTQPDFGVRVQNGDTSFLTYCNITLHGKALVTDVPVSSNCYALNAVACAFDSAGTITGGATVSCAELTPSGGLYDTKFSNCWFGISSAKFGANLAPNGAGVINGISFDGCEFVRNGDSGLLAAGAGVTNWVVTGGGSGGNTNNGIRAASGTTHFTITGHHTGNWGGYANNNYGIEIDSTGADYYLITGNNCANNTTAGILDQGTGTHAQVYDNLGYNGATNVQGLTVGASPYTYTAGHTPEILYIQGGTVSSVTIESTGVFSATNCTVNLVPNESVTVTYSALPTISRKKI